MEDAGCFCNLLLLLMTQPIASSIVLRYKQEHILTSCLEDRRRCLHGLCIKSKPRSCPQLCFPPCSGVPQQCHPAWRPCQLGHVACLLQSAELGPPRVFAWSLLTHLHTQQIHKLYFPLKWLKRPFKQVVLHCRTSAPRDVSPWLTVTICRPDQHCHQD